MELYDRIKHYILANTEPQQYEVGTRIACKPGDLDKWYYGYIYKRSGSTASIHMDRADKVFTTKLPLLVPTKAGAAAKLKVVPVEMWEDHVNGVPFSELVLTSMPTHKSASKFGFQTLRSMYVFINHRVYNGVLPIDLDLKFTTSSGNFGKVRYVWETNAYKVLSMGIAKHQHIVKQLFDTVCHESIHVFQAINATKPYPKERDSHGPTFTSWIPKFKAGLGADINIKADRDEQTEYAAAPMVKRKAATNKQRQQFIVAGGIAPNYIGARTTDTETINAVIQNRIKATIFRTDDARILTILKPIKYDPKAVSIEKMEHLPESAYEHLKKDAEVFWKQGDPANKRGLYGYYLLHIIDSKDFPDAPYGILVISANLKLMKKMAELYKQADIYDTPKMSKYPPDMLLHKNPDDTHISHYSKCLENTMPVLRNFIKLIKTH